MQAKSRVIESYNVSLVGMIMAIALSAACSQNVEADWGFQKVFDFSDGYPGTGAHIGVSGTNPTIHNDIVMFGVSGGGDQGIFRYERGSLISFADNGSGDIFSSVSVSSFEAHDPYGAFLANQGSGNGLYTRSDDNQSTAIPIATPFTPIPSGSGNFTSFGDHSIDGQRVTFIGFGSSSQRGIYYKDVNSLGDPSLIVEKNNAMPGEGIGGDTYQSFSTVSHRGTTAVFAASGNARTGVFFKRFDTLFFQTGTIADNDTTIPGQATNFTAFRDPAYNGSNSAFLGFGSGVAGIYTNQGAGALRTVADTGTAIPQASGNFTSFGQGSLSYDGDDFVFEGTGANVSGVYIEKNGVLEKVVATGDVIDGRTINSVSLGRDGLSSGNLAVRLTFSDGASTFYTAFSEHRWDPTGGAGGNWDDQANWPLGARPSKAVHTFVEPTGPALVQGPTNFTHMRSLTLGSQGAGIAELQLQTAGQVLIDEMLTVQTAGKLGGEGALHATGGINNLGEIDLGNNSVTLSGGLVDNHGLLRGDGQVANRVTNHTDGEIRVGAGQTIRFTGSSNLNNGEIRLLNGGFAEFIGPLTNAPTGRILGRGTLDVGGAGLTNAGNLALSGGNADVFGDVANQATGKVSISGNSDVTFWDDVTDSGTLFNVSTGSSVTFFGTAGFGITGGGDVFFEDDVTPGSSPGMETFGGNVHFGELATLEIEIGGSLPGSEFDVLDITGKAALGGTLDVSLLNLGGGLFAPSLGDSFEILNTDDGLDGTTFSTLNLPALSSGLFWNIDYDANNVLLEVVSEFTADFDNDADVDADDLIQWQGDFGQNGNSDSDADNDSDGADFLAWQQQFGSGVSGSLASSQTVPEPSTSLLASCCALYFFRRKGSRNF